MGSNWPVEVHNFTESNRLLMVMGDPNEFTISLKIQNCKSGFSQNHPFGILEIWGLIFITIRFQYFGI